MPPRPPSFTGFTLLLVVHSFGMGGAADWCVRHLCGLALPPVFTTTWGGGALFFAALLCKRSAQWRASNLASLGREQVELSGDGALAGPLRRPRRQPVKIRA